ncbi:hypothetical protein [Caballeronia udeis]|uniref:hypothetical protein n=1 Tax=Caballeronia udeis TaxID=1232866 RepID=UPI00078423A1|nr:hypothetical protein [Caballeronia udeis]
MHKSVPKACQDLAADLLWRPQERLKADRRDVMRVLRAFDVELRATLRESANHGRRVGGSPCAH